MNKIKVLIVDDSALIRQTYKMLLERDPEIEVIGTAHDPYIAVQKIQKNKPDVITLDIEMPKMDGLTFLRKIMKQAPMPVVVISNQTVKGAEVALKALEYGAVNVLSKPRIGSKVEQEESRISLVDSIKSAYFAKKKNTSDVCAIEKHANAPSYSKENIKIPGKRNSSIKLIAIGASTGGTEAIKHILEHLPCEMPPILIVQHMPEKFTASFAKRLNDTCQLRVKEAEHNELIENNTVYIAPGNYHMSLWENAGRKRIKISQGELVNRHRPSVNVLMDSVAQYVGSKSIGIMLTGMGDDGALSMKKMYDSGSFTIAQDEQSCAVFGMPQKAIQLGGVSEVMSLEHIADEICKLVAGQNMKV